MHGRLTSCHDTPLQTTELVSYRDFAHRLHGVSLHALVAHVRMGQFPAPAVWRGRNGQAQWRAHEVEQALGSRRVEVYDGEEVGPLGDP